MSPSPPQDLHAAHDPRLAAARDLARDSAEYVRAWSELLASEARLAQRSVHRLVVAAACMCALILAGVATLDALVVAALQHVVHDWAGAIAITLVLDLLALLALAGVMRGWWRNLGLPRSRRALSRLMERLQ